MGVPVSLALVLALRAGAGADTLSAVELFGLRTVREAVVREAIGLNPGDPVPESAGLIRARVRAIPGVADVDVTSTCCAEDGGTILYVGIREVGTPAPAYRAAPTGASRLPADVVVEGEAFYRALERAVRRGAADEDDSRGYALARDSAMRVVQRRFIRFAADRFDTLRRVLHTSADAGHRALAAQIIAYGADRRAVVRELLYAANDPADDVRNSAVRALAVLAQWANRHPEANVHIRADAFLGFLNSASWTDRNKGALALLALTASRNPALLSKLRSDALPSLAEMARWKTPAHALVPFRILARVAGLDDAAALRAWEAGERETVIARAMSR